MARKKISEHKAKMLLFPYLNIDYKGLSVNKNDNFSKISLPTSQSGTYVVKVDEGIKKRGKLGLIDVNVAKDRIENSLKKLTRKGYSQFLIESFVPHQQEDEKYISLQQVRNGVLVIESDKGGIEVESQKDNDIAKHVVDPNAAAKEPSLVQSMLKAMQELHISFIEVNPYLIQDGLLNVLDMAVEIDSASTYFVKQAWTPNDFIESKGQTPEEKAVEELAETSPASFKLNIINPEGSIFMLLSGGGASLVLADEYYNLGHGNEVANYGEYSGAPTEDEAYIYAQSVISAMLKSTAKNKVLLIAGGVANFTDVRITFKGIIRALQEKVSELKKHNIALYVRRGGPHQKEGLALMKKFIEENKLQGSVSGPETSLPEIVKQSLSAA